MRSVRDNLHHLPGQQTLPLTMAEPLAEVWVTYKGARAIVCPGRTLFSEPMPESLARYFVGYLRGQGHTVKLVGMALRPANVVELRDARRGRDLREATCR